MKNKSIEIAIQLATELYKYVKLAINMRCIRFAKSGESLGAVLQKVNSVKIYSVNSYEMYHLLHMAFQQNPSLMLQKVTILVRKKTDETREDLEILNRLIIQWERLKDEGKIGQLNIVTYDHDPTQYYAIFDNEMALWGQVLFDRKQPTGTTVTYLPLLFWKKSETGKQVIDNFHRLFDNLVNHYRK